MSGYKKLIDIGGGSGVYAIAFLRKSPHLSAVIYDFGEVVDIAREKIAEADPLDPVQFCCW